VYLEALLMARGYRVGTTLSPHLSRFNERVRLGGEPVGDDVLCDAFTAIESARDDITLTYFEFGILAALLVFRQANVDVTVLEVGLGGRLDAVNLVDASVTVITSIGIDHVAYLGPDRESIGAEKAGIMRRGVPCVFGEVAVPMSIVAAAEKLDVPLLRYAAEFCGHGVGDRWQFDGRQRAAPVRVSGLSVPRVALRNAATALQALLLLDPDAPIDTTVAEAASACLPGRFEWFTYRGVPVVVDVAHNPHGATFLAAQLSAAHCDGRTLAVAGFLQDKDAAGIVAALDRVIDEWVFVGTGSSRGQEGEISARKADTLTAKSVGNDLADVFDELAGRCSRHDRIVVLGSFDLAQRARALLAPAMVNGEVSGGQ
jgi:dihydrofolate synthase / folylpolyglutamate synthase